MVNRIYFFCGNARTFLKCFDSAYENVIDKLFNDNSKENTHILFNIKCNDPGPKNQKRWNFKYENHDKENLENEIEKFANKYNNITFHTRLLLRDEISDKDLLSQVRRRSNYDRHLIIDKRLARTMQSHYSIFRSGEVINEIELNNKIKFDYYIYIRPDLLFTEPTNNIESYSKDKVIIGKGPNEINCDHIAIIPEKYKNHFFNARIELYKTNKTEKFGNSEEIYNYTVRGISEKAFLGKYTILREGESL